MKTPLSLTLTIYQGQTFDDRLQLANEDGTPVDLTGFKAHMQAREEVTDVVPIFDWSTDTGEIVIAGAEGTISFNLPSPVTYALPTLNEVCQWVYDLLIYNNADPIYAERVISGVVIVVPAVTRPVVIV